MKITKRLLTSALAISLLTALFAEEGVLFKFKHTKGDAVVHVVTIEEAAYLNGLAVSRAMYL